MCKVLIIDDEFHAQEVLKKLISISIPDFFSHVFVADSIKEGVKHIKKEQVDLVFLDMHMPTEHGFKLFDYVDHVNFEVVFTTAHSNYLMDAVNAYGCMGYLMKPISLTGLKQVLDRFIEKYREKNNLEKLVDLDVANDEFVQYKDIKHSIRKEKGILLFSSINEISFIRIDEIIYCKASDNYCEIHTSRKLYTISKPLKEIEKAIERNSFIRVHRSYLVNIDYAIRMDKRSNSLVVKGYENNEEFYIPVTASGAKILMNVVS